MTLFPLLEGKELVSSCGSLEHMGRGQGPCPSPLLIYFFVSQFEDKETQRCKALSSEARAPPLPAFSPLSSKFPFIKIKPHFSLIFSCFPQQN